MFLAAAFAFQLAIKALEPRPTAKGMDLPQAPPIAALRLASVGEPIAVASLLSLYLQAFDSQPGVSIPFNDLDYDRVEEWLIRILEIDPPGQYPMLMASQIYSQVPDQKKQLQMLDLTYRQFLLDPNQRWRWLAHAAIVAKHRLHDLGLALRYARAINQHATSKEVPNWAKQMHIFVLEDMGEYESAKMLLGGLLASGAITDAHEARFLTERLNMLQAVEKSSTMSEK